MSEVLRTVIDAIAPVAATGGLRERLAAITPRTDRRVVVIVAGDHGCADPGVSLCDGHPTVIAARAIADGTAAVVRVAQAPVVLVDAGTSERLPDIAIRVGRGPTRDLTREPAMTVVDAALGLDAGIALAMSLRDSQHGLDAVAVGVLGLGSEVSAAALHAAFGAVDVATRLADGDALVADAVRLGAARASDSPLDKLAAFGGPETPVLAGLMLAVAATRGAVLLDGPATGAAARVAIALAPAVLGYLIPAHRGAGLGEPLVELGLGQGEGVGAAMLLSMLERTP
jgi:nicotinate-nucleotide--dimethylbenzimidazole phosphoribosyltransferase